MDLRLRVYRRSYIILGVTKVDGLDTNTNKLIVRYSRQYTHTRIIYLRVCVCVYFV